MIIRQMRKPAQDYVVILNAWVRDVRLTRRARGLLAELMSHRDGWQTTVEELVRKGPEGRDAIHGALRELTRLGYLVLAQERKPGGQMGEATYTVSMPTPPPTDLPDTADQEAADQYPVNQEAYKKTTSKKITEKTTDQSYRSMPRTDRAATPQQLEYIALMAEGLEQRDDYSGAADELRGLLDGAPGFLEADAAIKAAWPAVEHAAIPDRGKDLIDAVRAARGSP